ncbi:Na/Pi cotransporter family protein [Clostridium sp. SM-530-WT-3G]|uniref:Na/Pi cotransporter family protein n=1 Tax=Clostridium sp. SM-530-WT-3G TaxID=2725303 RepID=UPI00145EFA2B|nr:Na/Pi cotransporter family protein [Clostridium sp. SM-530-WT-3G]NME84031.1 Na/Pi cotransporter family protein [Clostridium sp. SM-530-WT-3G]
MGAIEVIIQLMGGLGLFIYGMKLMGDGLENAAGERLKNILEKVTSNRLLGVGIGVIVTAVIQSSSATTVMVVGFVNAGLMSLAQAAGVIMGANVGTTITAQLVAFNLEQVAPIFIFVGAALIMFAKAEKRREIGNIILGFGILFTGMSLMSGAMKPLASSPVFSELLVSIGEKWFIGIAAGAAITALLQSSSATTGILIALASTGIIDINIALPIIFGCNIGTCITALLASIGTNKNAHKAALLHLIFNLVGTIAFLPLLGLLAGFVEFTSPEDVSRQIANAHTVFNVINTALLLPFIDYIIKFINKVIPNDEEVEKVGTKYIDDRLLETPVIAAGQVVKETIRMANMAKKNVELSMKAFTDEDESLIKKVYDKEKIIDMLEESITAYLVKLAKCDLSDKEKDIVASTFHVIIDVERIGDHSENIAELATEKINKRLKYSKSAIDDLCEIYNSVVKALEISIDAYVNRDIEKAKNVEKIESKIDEYERDYRHKHIQRLYEGKCNAYAGAIYLDLLSALERIGDHSTNISESVLETFD